MDKQPRASKDSSWELIHDSYHFVRNVSLVEKAFNNYLNDLGSPSYNREMPELLENQLFSLGKLLGFQDRSYCRFYVAPISCRHPSMLKHGL